MVNFNGGWQFRLDEGQWQPMEIPHDWLIADAKNLYKNGIGQYKKTFLLEEADLAGKVFLRFDGIYMDSALFVNGKEAGQWKNGYTACTFDITEYVAAGENDILITVNHQSPNSRWYSGAGIYRDCWLIKKNAAHFVIDGIYVAARKDGDAWRVEIDSEVAADGDYTVQHSVIGLETQTAGDGILLAKNPKLWDIENPTCYILESKLLVGGQVADVAQTRFGFRQIEFTTHDGFFLNGRRVRINGACQHHDLGALGSAVSKDALRRQLTTLRDMGVNALRTAHNPPAEVFMELADEMGFLVMSEICDMWSRPKTKFDYARFFNDWIERDMAAWVRRDRNCPSIIMWSVGNEIYDTHASFEEGSKTMNMLVDLVKKHDPKGNGTPTLCSNYLPWENTQKCADIIKLIGYNYAEYLYHDHHEKNPSLIIYGGETASTVQSRGVYHFPLKKALLADDDLQCSALGNSATSWGAKSTEACVTNDRDASFSLGQFIWTGTDYIGEPTPYHTKNSYFGQIDTAGFPKDSFYIYKSAWTNFEKDPFVHLFPYWDWSPGQKVDVRIASNCPRVELFLNGKSLGITEIDHQKDMNLVANYIVEFEPGTIKAVAYDAAGKVLAEQERHSFGDAVEIKLTNTKIGELIFTEITALDKAGNPVENANNRVTVTVKNGQLLGLDNGDSTDRDQYQNNNSRRLFSGKLLAIVKPGENVEISAVIDEADIPIRKIELIRDGYTVEAKILPENASYSKIAWRLADESGIDSFLGNLTVSDCGRIATIEPKGDGEIYVRCSTPSMRIDNGVAVEEEHASLISLLPVTIEGFGVPFLDPYSFISGGLYNRYNVPMTNGNERGIATLRDGESQVGWADLDFGPVGSNEVTFGLFPLGGPFDMDIWLGMPTDAGARKLTTVRYDKGSVWNTYIPATFTLPEKIKGVQTLCVVVQVKVHIKGFQFTPPAKAFEQLNFADNDSIYGDSFTVTPPAVESIGNNVTVTFDHMDFTEAAQEIEICWRSKLDKNTIKLMFTDENGNETTNMLTLPAQANYAATVAKLNAPIAGKGSVSYIFLPGSEIDLEWFRFVK
ncbi:MAG: DUF4982 domain-containing protein [Defluviitaleaceae bacterium]|nr:DUF4982 domain-containing protein [Defluviitaleaceae bacterium]